MALSPTKAQTLRATPTLARKTRLLSGPNITVVRAQATEREVRDLVANLEGHESSVMVFNQGCKAGGSSELWTIADGSHVPAFSDTFAEQVVEWLLAHPKSYDTSLTRLEYLCGQPHS